MQRSAKWYRHAEMFVFPSVFAGFGMPPVEALGFGLPTLAARATAILAELVDEPLDAAMWADKIAALLDDPNRYRPKSDDVAALKDLYDPVRIAGAYIAAST